MKNPVSKNPVSLALADSSRSCVSRRARGLAGRGRRGCVAARRAAEPRGAAPNSVSFRLDKTRAVLLPGPTVAASSMDCMMTRILCMIIHRRWINPPQARGAA